MSIQVDYPSLVKRLGISGKFLYSVSNSIHKHYRQVKIPKNNGEYRQLYVPDHFLKIIQRKINENLLSEIPISPYATAYKTGGSTIANATPHIAQPMILKLDIRHFFDSIIYSVVKEKVFPEEQYTEANRVLLSLLCVYMDAVPQGAPTSPTISNIIMKEFDDVIGKWCQQNAIVYTRYCDDMTFSGCFDAKIVIALVKKELRKRGFFLNTQKTVVAKRGQKHLVTGLVTNEKLSVSKEYKKKIRQELYYCMKYGTESHLKQIDYKGKEKAYLHKLLGRINYVLSVEHCNTEMQEYQKWVSTQLQ